MNANLRLLTDEDFDNDIVRGLLRRFPSIDLIRSQDVGLAGKKDPVVLQWAAQNGRILLTRCQHAANISIRSSRGR